MTRESLREQLIASGAIRPAGHGKKAPPALPTDGRGILDACAAIIDHEGRDVAELVVANPEADPRVRARLARILSTRAAA
jgi:hypothetical protein